MTTKEILKRAQPQVGDIFQIPLPNGRFGYGRVFRDASVGVYRKTFDHPIQPPIESLLAFTVGLYDDILGSGTWPIIGNQPFASADDEWPPPTAIVDMISGEYSIYHRGVIRPSTEDECHGLEPTAVWDANHVIDRLMEGEQSLS